MFIIINVNYLKILILIINCFQKCFKNYKIKHHKTYTKVKYIYDRVFKIKLRIRRTCFVILKYSIFLIFYILHNYEMIAVYKDPTSIFLMGEET